MKKFFIFIFKNNLIKAISLFALAIGCFYVSFAFAQDTTGLAGIAENVRSSFDAFARLVTAGSVLAGLVLAFLAVLKFKQHKDAPTQVAISVPITYLFVAVALLFLPYLVRQAGATLFGTGVEAGTLSGVTEISGTT